MCFSFNEVTEKHTQMKSIVLTIDYELYFGSDSGTVENCMIRPTRKLMQLLERHGAKATVFWDVLHYYRLCEMTHVPELKIDKDLIEDQIDSLLRAGHDVQLHIHPHWLDAKWDGFRWIFDYKRFRLQSLNEIDDAEDINTILGCVTKGHQLIETFCRTVIADYKVIGFRAGAYAIEPFRPMKNALLANGIVYDSSVGNGMFNTNHILGYDFRSVPVQQHYRFSNTVMERDDHGAFLEFPIGTVHLSLIRKLYFALLRRVKYLNPGKYGDGRPLEDSPSGRSKTLANRLKPSYSQLTADNSFPEKWNYLVKKALANSVVIIHPKNLSPFGIAMIEQSLNDKKVQFISLKDRLNEIGL